MDYLTASKFLEGTRGRWLAAQGQYYKAINPTISTGIISATTTAFSATAAFVEFQHTAPVNSNVYAFLDYLRLIVKTVDAQSAGSSFQYALSLDNKLRYASGGTQIVLPGTYANNYGPVQATRTGPANIVSNGPQLAMFLGALVLNAESANVIRTTRSSIKAAAASPVAVVDDEYIFSFGPGEDVGSGSAKTGTTAAVYRQNVGIHDLAPQSSVALHFWSPNITTGLTVECEAAWWECPAYPA